MEKIMKLLSKEARDELNELVSHFVVAVREGGKPQGNIVEDYLHYIADIGYVNWLSDEIGWDIVSRLELQLEREPIDYGYAIINYQLTLAANKLGYRFRLPDISEIWRDNDD